MSHIPLFYNPKNHNWRQRLSMAWRAIAGKPVALRISLEELKKLAELFKAQKQNDNAGEKKT